MSGSRQVPFVTDQYYHVFNRGVAKQPTFTTEQDYLQARLAIQFYQYIDPPIKLSRYKTLPKDEKLNLLQELETRDKIVDIVSFVFMPNHWHFLLKQNTDNGITRFISQFSNSYTKYFNTKHARVGHLFQGIFKSVEIESEEQLLHVSRYIHLNPYGSGLVTKDRLKDYPWSSYPDYLIGNSNLVEMSSILHNFKSKRFSYENFVLDHSDYARELEYIKHLTIDID